MVKRADRNSSVNETEVTPHSIQNITMRQIGLGVLFMVYFFVSVAPLYRSPQRAEALDISDSVAYAVSAHRLATQGSFDVVVAEKSYPTRYQPGFPVLFLTPIYLIDSSNLGLGILPVFLSALVSLLIIRRVCHEDLPGIIGITAAFLALVVMFQTTNFYVFSRTVMSDIPTLMIGLLALLAFRAAWKQPRFIHFLAGGILTGTAGSIRMTALSLCLPFVFLLWRHIQPRQRFIFTLGLFVPIAGGMGTMLAYNHAVFGSPLLTGYHYWLSSGKYALTLDYFWENFYEFLNPFLHLFRGSRLPGQGLIGPMVLSSIAMLGFLCMKRRPEVWQRSYPVLLFLIFGSLPIFIFHLFYPFPLARFVLLFHTLAIILGGVWTMAFMVRLPQWALLGIAGLAAVLSFVTRPPDFHGPPNLRLSITKAAAEVLPQDAVFISNESARYVHAMVIEGTERHYIPFDRNTSAFSWEHIGLPGETPVVLYEFNALDAPEQVGELIRRGRRVFIHIPRRIRDRKALDRFLASFDVQRVWGDEGTQSLAELFLPGENLDERPDMPLEQIYKRTLAIREQVLGPDHPWTVKVLKGMVKFYTTEKKTEEVKKLRKRIREDRLKKQ